MNNQFSFCSISELSNLIKNKKISPIELTRYFLNKLETNGPQYNAIAHINKKSALKQAEVAEKKIFNNEYLGSLHGIPYAAKRFIINK